MPDKAAAVFPDPQHDHAPCVAETLERAEKIFENNGLRLTPLRRQVLREVAGSHTAIGAYDVLERLAKKDGRRLAPISVYRALDSLVAAGMVHRLESRNAFFACHVSHAGDAQAGDLHAGGAHVGERRQIVLACATCSAVAEVPGDTVFDGIAAAAAANGFKPTRALVEVIGVCGRCQAGGSA